MKYIYGPVKSRRLGLSLGVSMSPYKVCNFDCIYCQLGKTKEKVAERKEYLRPAEIIKELESWLRNNTEESKKLDYITISGLGEPTLNTGIAEVISYIKQTKVCKIAVITNASLLGESRVRRELLEADLIVPSLDSAIPEIFTRIDRPASGIKLENIIEGLISLRKEFKGKIWLEVMIVCGVNDDLKQVMELKEISTRVHPDKIQINSPVRTTAEDGVLPADKKRLQEIKEILGSNAEII